eukprot:CAMPEP_0184683974 /NCGR_PEP_ID=MMETSP0312-20130426/13392_1 /TAXON_ID=31354 /ORGANISM="Compsopogon coeruleus, Strain SAG 36.94" /LENGTH=412 /DNA_ID=CAMNT_0027136739 /DNA_START=1 /DNA_END=1239 /DNA_ORIENTATION=+
MTVEPTTAFAVPLRVSTGLNCRRCHQVCRRRIPRAVQMESTFDVERNIRPGLVEMEPYVPILPYEVLAKKLGRRPEEIVKLDANENPFGPSPAVKHALESAPFLHIYPDPECTELREELENYTGIEKEHLLVGCGADELIDLLFRLFVEPGAGHSVVNLPPTFGMYKFDSDVNGARVINVWRREDFSIPVEDVERVFHSEMAASNPPKMIFVTSPNNPDGSRVSDADLLRLLRLPTLVVLDEAYYEFSGDNRITWVKEHSNLVVLRTFSKWAALAGLRVGYGAFPLGVIKHLWKIKQPYNVSVAGQIAAIASLRDRGDLLSKVDQLIAQRARLYQKLQSIPFLSPYPSHSNFVLCKVENGRTASSIRSELVDLGILVRYYNSAGLEDCIRISMGTPEQMDKLFLALTQLAGQ